MSLIDALRELLGLQTEGATRRRDVTVSVERRSSSSDGDKSDDPITEVDQTRPDVEVSVDRKGIPNPNESEEDGDSDKEEADREASERAETAGEGEQKITKGMGNSISANHQSEPPQDSVEDVPAERSTDGSSQKSSSPEISVKSSEYADLTGFKRDLLIVIGGMETPKGMEILDELEDYYDENVNHGRLYPNLDDLVEAGYVEKISLNARSNGYNLTEKGTALLENRQQWVKQMAGPLGESNAQPNADENDEFEVEHEGAQPSTDGRQESDPGGGSESSSHDRPEDSKLVDDIMDGFDDLGEQTDE